MSMIAKSFLKKIKKINLQRWYLPLIVTLLFFLFFFAFFTPIYETNDDVFFTLIANGYYTKIPTPYFQISSGLQTIHIVIGRLLVFLYTSLPGLNWYSILMYAVAFLGLYAMLIPLFYTIKNRLLLSFSLVLLLLFATRFLLFLSFTSIAAISTMGGIFLLLFFIKSNYRNTFYFLFSVFLLIISQLIRQSSFVMIILFSVPLIFKICVDKKRGIIMFSILLLIILISIIVVRHSNISAYRQNPQWNQNIDFLFDRETYFYEPNLHTYETNRAVYKSIKWSKNDYLMFNYYFYEDPSVFSAEKIHSLLSSPQNYQTNFQSVFIILFNVMYLMLSSFEYLLIIIICFFIAWPTILHKTKTFIFFVISLVGLSILYFVQKGYLPTRVIDSMLFFLSYLPLFFISNSAEIFSKKKSNILSFKNIIISSIIIVFSISLLKLNSLNKAKSSHVTKMIQSLPKNDSLILIWGSSLPYQWQYVFSSNSEFNDIHFLIGAWTQRTPLNEEIKKKYHIENIYKDLYSKENFYLLASEWQKKLLRVFMQAHYNVKITYDVVSDYSFNDYRFQLLKVKSHPR